MTAAGRRDLVIVAAGDASLHEEYAAGPRNFDLWIIYYGDSPGVAERYARQADALFLAKGYKIDLMRKLLLGGVLAPGADASRYRFVFLPDDDIRFPGGIETIHRMFEVAEATRADIFQPAIANEHFSPLWEPTRLIPDAVCHRVNLVEIMMHGFSAEAFANAYLPAVHTMGFMKAGWGIEPIIMKIGEAVLRRPLRTFVLDCVPALHTKPVGGNGALHEQGRREWALVPQAWNNPMKTLRIYRTLAEAAVDRD